jgi:hypothetical protein
VEDLQQKLPDAAFSWLKDLITHGARSGKYGGWETPQYHAWWVTPAQAAADTLGTVLQ